MKAPARAAPRRILRRLRRRRFALLAILGPGLIAATAGDDAGGIATYASVGAEFGFALLWALVLITISLALVQEMAERMGAVTGKGFAELVRERMGIRVTAFVMLALLVANTGLVISEFAGIGAAGELFGIPRLVSVPLMALILWAMILRGSYDRVERIFLLMALALFAYPIAAIVARPDWSAVGQQLVSPSVTFNTNYLTLFIALVGTTITPYMQIFLQSSVAERGGNVKLAELRLDAYSGAIFSDLVAAFIIIAAGATLFPAGIKVVTAGDAARALEPLAGPYAADIFGVGLFGASVLAAAVLPLATAYPITEAFGFEKGISSSFHEAPIFHGLFAGLIALGALVALLPGINVIQLLVSTQVLNGILLPIELITMLRLVNNPEIMGQLTNGRLYNAVAWLTVTCVLALSTAYLAITLLGLIGVRVLG